MPNVAEIGELGDRLSLYIDGQLFPRAIKYSFSRGIFQQPATFSLTAGSGDVARELLSRLRPKQRAEIKIGETTVFTGLLEDPGSDNGGGATEVTVEGRCMLAPLTKEHVLDEFSWGTPTYFDMTKKVMEIVGYKNTKLVDGNDANRNAASRVKTKTKGGKKAVEVIQTNLTAADGAKVEYQKVDCEIGNSWFDFLVAQYKRIGLYLWSSCDGNLVLARPTAFMFPSYQLQRFRGHTRIEGNILKHSFKNRTSGRHARVRVYGKGRPDKNGHIALYGNWEDYEMIAMGFTETMVRHDDDCKTQRDCQYRAKRLIAEERRANRTLTYTVSGHTVPVFGDESKRAIWTPDTVVRVEDDEVSLPSRTDPRTNTELSEKQGIHEDMYVERVDFNLDASGTTTTLHLMRVEDLMFLGDDTERYLGESETKRETSTTLVAS